VTKYGESPITRTWPAQREYSVGVAEGKIQNNILKHPRLREDRRTARLEEKLRTAPIESKPHSV